MIFITQHARADARVLKVDGYLSAEDIDVLVRACEAEAAGLVLDLSDLRFADRTAVGTLRGLRARGITFTGLSPYLSLLLDSPGIPDGG